MKKPRKPIKRSRLKPSKKRIKRTGIKRKPHSNKPKPKKKKNRRKIIRDRYERDVRQSSPQNAPPYPNGSPIAPDGQRWQLDHIWPIAKGKQDMELCTVERMSSGFNLQWLTRDENIKKGARMTKEGIIRRDTWRQIDLENGNDG